MKKFIFAAVLFCQMLHSQVYITSYGEVSAQVSQANILTSLTEFQNFGVKYRGTPAQANTLQWLKDKYLSYGYSATQIVEDPFTYSGSTCKNLIVTKTGTLYPNTFVIIDGHYDTVNGPGTNDNGSGTAVILETARLLQNVPTEYSIKFIHFSGEEDGLRGSQHYVNNVVNATTPKMDIRLLFNLDQVGGVAGEVNNTITCERDQSSPNANNAASNTMTQQLMNCVELYSPLNAQLSYAYASDYMPFQSNGEIITGFYETNESPFPHTANDVLANMDPVFVYNVAKAAVGAMMHFAVACTTCSLGNGANELQELTVYPNPATHILNIEMADFTGMPRTVLMTNVLGKTIFKKQIASPSGIESIDLGGFAPGVYFLSLENGTSHFVKKIIIAQP